MIKINRLSLLDSKTGSFILKDVSATFEPGKIIFLVGKSGSGKTSLLRCLACLRNDYQGEILIQDTDLRQLSPLERVQMIGFVFQHYNLFPHLTVLENCSSPLRTVLKVDEVKANDRALNMLELLEVSDLASRYPSTLSGGQQQRVAVARALCFEPNILLLDEPTSALDEENMGILGHKLKRLAAEGKVVIVASQDSSFIASYADEILVVHEKCIETSSLGSR